MTDPLKCVMVVFNWYEKGNTDLRINNPSFFFPLSLFFSSFFLLLFFISLLNFMTLYKLFRTKRKLRRKDAQRTSTTDLDKSGILAQPFPPMVCRAKSPCDILDFVGYPRIQPLQSQSPPIKYSAVTESLPLTIRNKTPSSITTSVTPTVTAKVTEQAPVLIVHQVSSSTSPRDLSEVQMPTPRKAMPPTWRLLSAGQAEKTLVEDKQCTTNDAKQVILLHQQKIDFELERQDWARREEQHRQLEQQMLQRIKENQAKIDQLSSYSPKPSETRKGQKSCTFTPRPRPQDCESLSCHSEEKEEYEYDVIGENEHQFIYQQPERSNRIMDHPYSRRIMYSQNRLVIAPPMNWNYYPSYYSKHDNDDDDGYDSKDDESSFFEEEPCDTRRHSPYIENSDDGDDEDEQSSLDDDPSYMNRQWRQSKPVYYAWQRESPGYIHAGGMYQQQPSCHSAFMYNQPYYHRPPSKERKRQSLIRHYSYEDVYRNGFTSYIYH
ncbi:hypothetical protein BC941DRAFT_428246 [Chlamydoabsidia padenii]|nr:hypothetical protein BC941DRAFT_428246 [Chlamydoabsidia padenii]